MNYNLTSKNGRINYIMLQQTGPVGSEITLENANRMLAQNKPRKSKKFDGYPIAVKVDGCDYFFDGEWIDEQNGENVKLDGKKPKKRVKDAVCGNDYCELE